MLQAREGVEEQQRFVRGSPAAAGELTDAVEPGEQSLPVERDRGWWLIEGWLRHRVKIEQLWARRKCAHPGQKDLHSNAIGVANRTCMLQTRWPVENIWV